MALSLTDITAYTLQYIVPRSGIDSTFVLVLS